MPCQLEGDEEEQEREVVGEKLHNRTIITHGGMVPGRRSDERLRGSEAPSRRTEPPAKSARARRRRLACTRMRPDRRERPSVAGSSRPAALRFAEQRAQALPVERRTGIGLAARSDVAVPGEVGDRIARSQRRHESREARVLSLRVRPRVGAFELDADREIVAALASLPRRDAGVPCARSQGTNWTSEPSRRMKKCADTWDRGSSRRTDAPADPGGS